MATYTDFTPTPEEWKALGTEITSILDRYVDLSEEKEEDATVEWLLNLVMMAFSARPAYFREGYELHADLPIKEYPLIHKYILNQIAQVEFIPSIPLEVGELPDVLYYHKLQPNPLPGRKFTTTTELGTILGYPCPREFDEGYPKAVAVHINVKYKDHPPENGWPLYAYVCNFDHLVDDVTGTVDDAKVTKYKAILTALGLSDTVEIVTTVTIYDQQRRLAANE